MPVPAALFAAQPPPLLPETEPVLHGGDLAAARRRFPGAPLPFLDLSTGLNPWPYPVGEVPPEAWHRLPGPDETRFVEAEAAALYRTEASRVVAAPGTQALIQLLPRLLPARRVAILGFGYQEHPSAWCAAGADVQVVESLSALAEADVAVVINPNNPDGRYVEPEALATLAERLSARGGTLVVDEAFADAIGPEASLAPHGPPGGAVVLRSFGKFFGLAGVRLGFAVTNAALATRLRAALGPWAVSGPALAVAGRALADRDWQRATRLRLAATATRLDATLAGAGLPVLGGTPLFRLASSPDAGALADRLGRAGILVRSFPQRSTWLRFGLPGTAAEEARLAAGLRL